MPVYPPALGCVPLGLLWGCSCAQRRWGCTSHLPSAAGLCRPAQLWPPALVSFAALRPTASIHTTPAAGWQNYITTNSRSTGSTNSAPNCVVGEEREGRCHLGLKREGPVPERSLLLLSFSPSVLPLSAERETESVQINQIKPLVSIWQPDADICSPHVPFHTSEIIPFKWLDRKWQYSKLKEESQISCLFVSNIGQTTL